MQDVETVNLLPGFLKTVEKLGFQEKPELSTGVDEQVYVKGNWMLYVFPKLGIWLLEGRNEADGNFADGGCLEYVVEEVDSYA